MEGACPRERVPGALELDVAADDRSERRGALDAVDALPQGRVGLARLSVSRLFPHRGRYRRGLPEEGPEVIVGPAQPDEEVGDIPAFTYLFG